MVETIEIVEPGLNVWPALAVFSGGVLFVVLGAIWGPGSSRVAFAMCLIGGVAAFLTAVAGPGLTLEATEREQVDRLEVALTEAGMENVDLSRSMEFVASHDGDYVSGFLRDQGDGVYDVYVEGSER